MFVSELYVEGNTQSITQYYVTFRSLSAFCRISQAVGANSIEGQFILMTDVTGVINRFG